ncbi:hypothetical protein BD408DRAFT_415202 [Parasitella parasitica]|nr:hypothetical protein BD408DRAFT_415202 [Parasitella parasitica]
MQQTLSLITNKMIIESRARNSFKTYLITFKSTLLAYSQLLPGFIATIFNGLFVI